MRALRPAALVVAGGLALAACGSSATTASDAGAPSEEAASVFSGEFATISGETFDFGSLEGQDVVLWFWAPW